MSEQQGEANADSLHALRDALRRFAAERDWERFIRRRTWRAR